MRVCSTAAEAKAYLANIGLSQSSDYFRQPNLIVSNFKPASQTALEFVQWLRGAPELPTIRVIILSDLSSQMDPSAFAA